MRKLKLYLETTVFNRYFEPERDYYGDTLLLFDQIAAGNFEAYTSQYVVDELARAPEPKRQDMLNLLKHYQISFLEKSKQAESLANEYVKHHIISIKHSYDCWHIACAAVNGMDVIISFNLSHINRISTIEKTELVNRLNGYPAVKIALPMGVIDYEDN
ncbi:MAG: PIN domain-containing protein [Firmicutes bacterium]|nr:PIN domain-containing protein [Bacillota bacterium]